MAYLEEQPGVLFGVLIGTLCALVLIVMAFRHRPAPPSPLSGRIAGALLYLFGAGATWLECYVAIETQEISGGKRPQIHHLVNDPHGYWASVLITYFLGVIFFGLAIAILLPARSTPR